MRIAVINDVSSADRNADILAALAGRGHTVINAGMQRGAAQPGLHYVQTGFAAGLLLNLNRVDLVVGGCASGQGFMAAAMQYPGVFCGLIRDPVDAWLFAQVNAGNCISLPAKVGYGFGGDVNLRFVFDRLFSAPWGGGYPPQRSEPQQVLRQLLNRTSEIAHRRFADSVAALPDDVVLPVLSFPGMSALLDFPAVEDAALRDVLQARRGAA
ncbi:MAG: RpiB/LacA/LacB family sugar-phosphate isomerase [Anaerolineae bacterium]|nr:RpiB/LacA/LacB family sugar-phosphate isomerase [Anaerolineae bacterium]